MKCHCLSLRGLGKYQRDEHFFRYYTLLVSMQVEYNALLHNVGHIVQNAKQNPTGEHVCQICVCNFICCSTLKTDTSK
jgi:hypothetical protein